MFGEAKAPKVGPVAKALLRTGGGVMAVGGATLVAGALADGAKADDGSTALPGDTDVSTDAGILAASSAVAYGVNRQAMNSRSDKLLRTKAGIVAVAGLTALHAGVSVIEKLTGGRKSPGGHAPAPPKAFGAPSADGKAFLNDGARSKAQSAPEAPRSSTRASMQSFNSDGQTEGYVRQSRTGKAVQVKGYSTPKR